MTDDQKPQEPEEGQGSEVKRLREQINTEYQAAQRGFTGSAQGTSKHEFMTAKTERIGKLVEDLKKISVDEAKKALEEMGKADQQKPEEPA